MKFGFSKQKLEEKGLQFEIENNGKNLSQGEKQLISLFRVFYSKQKIIIMDEATSAIDYQTEQKIIEYIYTFLKDRTII